MQIFRPHQDHYLCAMVLDDSRLGCQGKEIGQMASTAIWMEDCGIAETLYARSLICLPTHEHNSLTKYIKYCYRESLAYMFMLWQEYKYRFGKEHQTFARLPTYISHTHLFDKYGCKPFINHTSDHRHIEDVNEAYRQCLIEKWSKEIPTWTKRQRPAWAK